MKRLVLVAAILVILLVGGTVSYLSFGRYIQQSSNPYYNPGQYGNSTQYNTHPKYNNSVTPGPAFTSNYTGSVNTTITQDWVKEPGVLLGGNTPGGAGTGGLVQLPNGEVRMYAGLYGFAGIVSYISQNGVNFTREPGYRISLPAGGGSIGQATVVQLKNGDYRMYYQSAACFGCVNIWTAVSGNGLNFTGMTQISDPQDPLWNSANGFWSMPGAYMLPNGSVGLYYMWSEKAGVQHDPAFNSCASGFAFSTSSDGIHFKTAGCVNLGDHPSSLQEETWWMLPNGTVMFMAVQAPPPPPPPNSPPVNTELPPYGIYVAYSINGSFLNFGMPRLAIAAPPGFNAETKNGTTVYMVYSLDDIKMIYIDGVFHVYANLAAIPPNGVDLQNVTGDPEAGAGVVSYWWKQ